MAYILDLFRNQMVAVDKRLTDLESNQGNRGEDTVTFARIEEQFTGITDKLSDKVAQISDKLAQISDKLAANATSIFDSRKLTENVLLLKLDALVKRLVAEGIHASNVKIDELKESEALNIQNLKNEIVKLENKIIALTVTSVPVANPPIVVATCPYPPIIIDTFSDPPIVAATCSDPPIVVNPPIITDLTPITDTIHANAHLDTSINEFDFEIEIGQKSTKDKKNRHKKNPA